MRSAGCATFRLLSRPFVERHRGYTRRVPLAADLDLELLAGRRRVGVDERCGDILAAERRSRRPAANFADGRAAHEDGVSGAGGRFSVHDEADDAIVAAARALLDERLLADK